jgi:iron(III) transport system substrate-binding protein
MTDGVPARSRETSIVVVTAPFERDIRRQSMLATLRRGALAAAAVALCTSLAAAGAVSATTVPDDTSGGGSAGTTAGSAGSAEADAALADLVAAAQEEGSVTVYTSQGLDQINALAAAFEEEYGIDVEPVRLNDGDMIPRLETEINTGASGADAAYTTALPWIEGQAEAGNFLDPTASPQIAGLGAYDADQYVHDGNYFEVGAAVLTFAWNTEEVPEGINDYPDLLNEEFAGGRLGVIDPNVSPSVVDFWRFLEENFGEDYVAGLAELEPRIYNSALPIGEALGSGEIAATVYAAPVTLVPAAEAGAPVDFGISEAGAWGARYYGLIPKSAEHPAAAALFSDFMLTPLGQELVQGASGSVLPDIPGTLITNDQVRVMDEAGMQPDAVAEYVAKWDELFR